MVTLSLALILRLAACWYWAEDLTQDRDAYLGIARNITAGNGFCSPDSTTPTAFRPPIFPILIGIVRLVLPDAVTVGAINIGAGLTTVWAVWLLVGLWWQAACWKRVAATLAIAFDPLLLRYTAQPMTECVFTALTACTVVGVTRLWINPLTSWRIVLLTGVIAGLAALCRPTLYPFVGMVGLSLLFVTPCFHREEFRSRFRQTVYFVVGASLVVGLWVGRNLVVMNVPLLTTTHGGYTLLLGNNPVFYEEVAQKPWGTVWGHDSLIRWQESIAAEMQHDLGERVSEVAADRWHSQRAWKEMYADPAGFRAAVWYRVRSFWSLAPRGPEASGGRLSMVIAGWYATLFALAAIGFFNAVWRRHPAVWIGGLLIATVVGLHLLYWTDTRMRARCTPCWWRLLPGRGW